MSILVTVDCPSFFLPSSRYEGALAAIQELAEDSPEEFDDPEAVADASDLLAALDAESWKAETDAAGITKLSYVADKAPYDSDEDWPAALLGALAPFVTTGDMTVSLDGTPTFHFRLHDGNVERLSPRRGH
ncbi:hypothetical protein [Polyangium aurulentum]|uniref:hypothetical protein n=1 Tax=Polyangium aurulentum TaxID=2567896 RepID=UPI0010AE3FFC|nr:hypothetical protein [Polyangium aurulentum]UQA57027.1 hypothetical protein E8A73_037910 [Polyangium aurulentum]